MVLSKKSWYSKFYFFIQSWWEYSRGNEWKGDHFAEGKAEGTDICTFMRAFLLKLPFMIVCHITMFWLLFFTFIQFPIDHLGLTGYFMTGFIICGIIGLGFGVYYGERKLRSHFDAKPSKPARTEPTFLELFCVWIKARHDKICVLMTFEDEETEDVKTD